MTMPGLQERPCGEETPSTLPAFEDSSAQGHPLALSTSPEHAKHWLKNYRTGVASLSSSFLSTAATVRTCFEASVAALVLMLF